MNNPAVNTNINTANSRADMAQDQNIVKLINRANNAIKSRGGNLESPVSKAIVNRAIMLYKQGQGKKVVTAAAGILATNTFDEATGTYSHAGKTGLTQAEYQASVAAAQAGNTTGETKTAAELAAEAAAKAKKAALDLQVEKNIEGQQELISDISTQAGRKTLIESPDVETIMEKVYDANGNVVSTKVPEGTNIAASAGQITDPVALAGKTEYVAPVKDADGNVITEGYNKSTGPSGVATATDVEKPDDITASKTNAKTALGATRMALSGGERDYVTVPLENVKFDPMVFPGGEVPAELQAQLAPTEEEQVKINEVSARLDPQITEANTSVTNFVMSDPPTEEETAELKRLQGIVATLEEQKKVESDRILDVTFHNPATGEKIKVDRKTAVLSNPPEGFVKGEPEGKFKDGSLESAQGTVSEEAKIAAQTGDAKKITGTSLDKIAQLGTNIFDADGNAIVDKNGEPIKGNFTQINALDETTKRKLQTEDIYDASGNLVSKKETLDETGFTVDEQKDVDDALTKTMQAAQIDTGATDVYDAEGKLVKKGDKGYTVQAQLEGLMEDFEGGATPAWAAGAMRQATATLAARGLGASSMAGQAIVQAAMEAALPIAQADASIIAQFERDNLSNRQQSTILAAQQRAEFLKVEFDQKFQSKVLNAAKVFELANLNFTANQQITLENARLAQTANIANMSATNAKTMADASNMAAMDFKNLDNKQQAAVLNAKSFLEMDMTNLTNAQEALMFKSQAISATILSDTAAENASRQFNASSENQTNQFMANLKTSVDLTNAAQQNAISMSNANAENTLEQFNTSLKENREQFESGQGLVIAQANAQWRQNAATLDSAAQNEANMVDAATINTFTKATVDQIWQQERDIMDHAEQGKDRALSIVLADKTLSEYQAQRDDAEDTDLAKIFFDILID
tara:strand:+ start:81 stop:2855 length:2775 start_codon:yes stop_codon:yes gene_type:complete